jgi:hypothetical protein
MEPNQTSLTVVTTTPSTMRGDDNEQVRRLAEKKLPLDTLQQSFTQFLQSLQQMVAVEQARAGNFVLEEIAFRAEIGVDGEFKLLGTGVGASATSGVTFTLRLKLDETTPHV